MASRQPSPSEPPGFFQKLIELFQQSEAIHAQRGDLEPVPVNIDALRSALKDMNDCTRLFKGMKDELEAHSGRHGRDTTDFQNALGSIRQLYDSAKHAEQATVNLMERHATLAVEMTRALEEGLNEPIAFILLPQARSTNTIDLTCVETANNDIEVQFAVLSEYVKGMLECLRQFSEHCEKLQKTTKKRGFWRRFLDRVKDLLKAAAVLFASAAVACALGDPCSAVIALGQVGAVAGTLCSAAAVLFEDKNKSDYTKLHELLQNQIPVHVNAARGHLESFRTHLSVQQILTNAEIKKGFKMCRADAICVRDNWQKVARTLDRVKTDTNMAPA